MERTAERIEMYNADELFLSGTAAEITPIVSVDQYEVGNGEISPMTDCLEKHFSNVRLGKEAHYERWRTPVPVHKMAAI